VAPDDRAGPIFSPVRTLTTPALWLFEGREYDAADSLVNAWQPPGSLLHSKRKFPLASIGPIMKRLLGLACRSFYREASPEQIPPPKPLLFFFLVTYDPIPTRCFRTSPAAQSMIACFTSPFPPDGCFFLRTPSPFSESRVFLVGRRF